jgi:hypothetical protein
MDIWSILTSSAVSSALLGVLYVLFKLVVSNSLEQQKESHKHNLEYELEAKKHLYHMIGPLKFQLLLAASEASRSIENHGKSDECPLNIDNNIYGRGIIYRILRPFAICELIERQISFADFAVDSAAVDLLIFKRSSYDCFSKPLRETDNQTEKWSSDVLNQAACALIMKHSNGDRIISFDKFSRVLDEHRYNEGLSQIIGIFNQFSISQFPILWFRLVAFAYLCRTFTKEQSSNLRFERNPVPIRELLEKADKKMLPDGLDACENYIIKDIRKDL